MSHGASRVARWKGPHSLNKSPPFPCTCFALHSGCLSPSRFQNNLATFSFLFFFMVERRFPVGTVIPAPSVIRSFRSYFARHATRPLFSLLHRASDRREFGSVKGALAQKILHTRHSAATNCNAYHLFDEHARMGSSGQMCDKCRYGGGKEK